MMGYTTYGELKEKVERELDIETEDFIQPLELLGYCNDGIKRAHALINKLGLQDEYFLAMAPLALTSGVNIYALPANVYANKLKRVVYQTPEKVYEIKRLSKTGRFLSIGVADSTLVSDDVYNYMLVNQGTASGTKLYLYPAAKETSATNVRIWYTREPERVVDENSLVDIPEEFDTFIAKYMEWRVLKKEGHPNTQASKTELDEEEALLVSTLANMVADDADMLEKDYSAYQEFV